MAQTDHESRQPKDGYLLESTIGNFGKWQLKISVLMALLKFPLAWFQLGIVFLAPPTQFWCKAPDNDYSNFTINNNVLSRMKAYKNVILRHEGLNTGYCQMNEYENSSSMLTNCSKGFEYNRTVFHTSIITEWDLVCENKRLVDMTQIIFMLGVLMGNVMFGIFADRYGRKKSLMICICLQSLFGMAAAWIPWFWAFIALRFFLAVANGGLTVISFVMCMEVVGGTWQTIVPILYQIPYAFGNSIMAGLAYYLTDWRDFQFILSLLSMFYVLYFWLVPESPRWLLAVGRKKEAAGVLENAAKCNNLCSKKIHLTLTNLLDQDVNITKPSISTLFAVKELKSRTILLCINWLIGGVTFFAFSQYVGKVARNIYVTVAVSGFVALPGTLFCVYVISRFGRRWTIATAHFLTGFCFLAILSVPAGVYVEDWPRILFAGLGIVGLSISTPALFLFAGELFPTTVRNVGVGTTTMFSRIGSMIAPLVIAMEEISLYLPLLILSVMAIAEGLLILLLPETKGTVLPETIHDLQRTETVEQINTVHGSYISVPKVISAED